MSFFTVFSLDELFQRSLELPILHNTWINIGVRRKEFIIKNDLGSGPCYLFNNWFNPPLESFDIISLLMQVFTRIQEKNHMSR